MTTYFDPVADKDEYLPYYPAPAPGLRALADILEDLRRPIHPDLLRTKQKKGTDITFIEWHSAYRILEKYAMGFHYRCRTSLSLDGQHVTCDAEIGLVSGDYGITWRGSSGSDEDGDEGAKNYGDATDRAESQALRRAAAKCGLALPLYYDKNARTGRPAKPAPGRAVVAQETPQRGETPTATLAPITDGERVRIAAVADRAPVVPATGSTVTEKQVKAIYAIARAARHQTENEVDTRCKELFNGRKPNELNKAEASQFIDVLKGEQAA